MCTLEIGSAAHDPNVPIAVDRDGVAHSYPAYTAQGFNVWLDGFKLHFMDERVAADMARKILQRLGELP